MVTFLLLVALYFLPTLVASLRGLRAGGILLLNVLFGWTGIGWLALLVYAVVTQPVYWYPVAWPSGPARRW